MIDIQISIHCPDLITAAGLLAGARQTPPAQAAPVLPQEAPKPSVDPTPAPAPKTAPVAPVTPQTAPVGNVVPLAPTPAKTAPAEPGYTVQDIARAGAMLIQADPSIQPRLQELPGQFGARSVMELKPEQLPAFADALRSLGAKL